MNSKELAKLAGVSQATISLALNDSPLVAAETKERVLALAKEHHFTVNSQARGLRIQKSNVVAMIFPQHFVDFYVNHYFNVLYHRIRNKLAPMGLELVAVYPKDSKTAKGSRTYLDTLLRAGKADGVISFRTDLYCETLDYMAEKKIPCVYILNDESSYTGGAAVIHDNTFGAALVAEYFLSQGIKRVFSIGLRPETTASPIRMHSFYRTFAQHGIVLGEDDSTKLDISYFEAAKAYALENVEKLKTYNALFIHSDIAALGTVEGLRECGVRVPEDIKIVGYDDNPLGTWFYPNLSTVTSVDDEAAETVSALIKDGLDGMDISDRKYVFRPRLIVRSSSLGE